MYYSLGTRPFATSCKGAGAQTRCTIDNDPDNGVKEITTHLDLISSVKKNEHANTLK